MYKINQNIVNSKDKAKYADYMEEIVKYIKYLVILKKSQTTLK